VCSSARYIEQYLKPLVCINCNHINEREEAEFDHCSAIQLFNRICEFNNKLIKIPSNVKVFQLFRETGIVTSGVRGITWW